MKDIWGDTCEKDISIPDVIDDYNYNILGVEKSDQLIAYYRPVVRVRRYWMELMFHCLDIMRINGCIISNKSEGGIGRSHKSSLDSWIEALLVVWDEFDGVCSGWIIVCSISVMSST